MRFIVNFEYELTKDLKIAKPGQDVDFRVEGYVSEDEFYIIKAEVYAMALDEFFDCTEMFKRRTSYVEKINEMAAEDLADSKLNEEFENWID